MGGVADLCTLVAAVLHDTVEDTETTPEDVEGLFGAEVRALVDEVTDDKSLPKAKRKRLQIEHAPSLSLHAKEIKIADKISNILDITHNPPAGWSPKRKREYLEWADKVVAGCRGVNQGLDRWFDEVLRDARLSIGMDRIDLMLGRWRVRLPDQGVTHSGLAGKSIYWYYEVNSDMERKTGEGVRYESDRLCESVRRRAG